jgi:hypothetical protein
MADNNGIAADPDFRCGAKKAFGRRSFHRREATFEDALI